MFDPEPAGMYASRLHGIPARFRHAPNGASFAESSSQGRFGKAGGLEVGTREGMYFFDFENGGMGLTRFGGSQEEEEEGGVGGGGLGGATEVDGRGEPYVPSESQKLRMGEEEEEEEEELVSVEEVVVEKFGGLNVDPFLNGSDEIKGDLLVGEEEGFNATDGQGSMEENVDQIQVLDIRDPPDHNNENTNDLETETSPESALTSSPIPSDTDPPPLSTLPPSHLPLPNPTQQLQTTLREQLTTPPSSPSLTSPSISPVLLSRSSASILNWTSPTVSTSKRKKTADRGTGLLITVMDTVNLPSSSLDPSSQIRASLVECRPTQTPPNFRQQEEKDGWWDSLVSGKWTLYILSVKLLKKDVPAFGNPSACEIL
ncbi:hypothetical protein HDV05_001793, partial [Chytridiales sp. JEL 0842]